MKIIILIFIIIISILYIGKNFFYLAKRNLFRDQAAWSGKDIKINYRKLKEVSESKRSDNYLKVIAEESKIYLEDQDLKEEE